MIEFPADGTIRKYILTVDIDGRLFEGSVFVIAEDMNIMYL